MMSTEEKASTPGEEAIAPTPEGPIVHAEKGEEDVLEPVGEPLPEGSYGWVIVGAARISPGEVRIWS
jgi:hypothetical protein